MGDDDEDEGCLATCRKLRSAAINYGGSFLAVCCAFIAFDVAYCSKPIKDPSNDIATFTVDVWTGPKPVRNF